MGAWKNDPLAMTTEWLGNKLGGMVVLTESSKASQLTFFSAPSTPSSDNIDALSSYFYAPIEFLKLKTSFINRCKHYTRVKNRYLSSSLYTLKSFICWSHHLVNPSPWNVQQIVEMGTGCPVHLITTQFILQPHSSSCNHTVHLVTTPH